MYLCIYYVCIIYIINIRTVSHVHKRASCQKAIVVINGTAHCFHDFILSIYLLYIHNIYASSVVILKITLH